jgi:hypothetical protein
VKDAEQQSILVATGYLRGHDASLKVPSRCTTTVQVRAR